MASRINMPATRKSITWRFFALSGVSSRLEMAVSAGVMLCALVTR